MGGRHVSWILVGASRLPILRQEQCFMRCAALFGGRPERGAAGLANDVRGSHVLIGDSVLVVGVWVQLQLALFFLLVEAEPEDTTPSLARRLALIVSLQFLQE